MNSFLLVALIFAPVVVASSEPFSFLGKEKHAAFKELLNKNKQEPQGKLKAAIKKFLLDQPADVQAKYKELKAKTVKQVEEYERVRKTLPEAEQKLVLDAVKLLHDEKINVKAVTEGIHKLAKAADKSVLESVKKAGLLPGRLPGQHLTLEQERQLYPEL
ncbi:unnamed protein product [Bursaphelenchus okinawaensis]|uniref:Uncharacterized protein n=1 Tax=Bursaphelenchus okinawaensis TaxID=465554 RepID=A0A811L7R1_9BILA|nr:unnamed protein product [Bursaphelenchus okinawaensis]CAG9117333.1 unnamed protein product [Bursaphelenchus okinawaensis]